MVKKNLHSYTLQFRHFEVLLYSINIYNSATKLYQDSLGGTSGRFVEKGKELQDDL